VLVSARRRSLARLLGARIAALRSEIGLTQERLAWEAEIESKGYMSRIESGQRLPSIEVLERIARCLGVEVRDLFIFPDASEADRAMEQIRRGTSTKKR
jgi:transcriptional regulator with XRE-family HTH domain